MGLAASVKVGQVRRPVRPYVSRPLQCRNCMKLKHATGPCPSEGKSDHCAVDHKATDCTSRDCKCVNFMSSLPRGSIQKLSSTPEGDQHLPTNGPRQLNAQGSGSAVAKRYTAKVYIGIASADLALIFAARKGAAFGTWKTSHLCNSRACSVRCTCRCLCGRAQLLRLTQKCSPRLRLSSVLLKISLPTVRPQRRKRHLKC